MKNSKNKNNKRELSVKIAGGIAIGFVNGFFGGGGGMLAVPLMIYLLKTEPKKAHATALFIILPLSIISSIFYIVNEDIEWGTLTNVLLGVLVGGIIGAVVLNKLSNKVINFIFAIIMMVAGIKLII